MSLFFKVLEETNSPHNGKIKVVSNLEGVRILVGGISQSGWLVKKVWQTAIKKIVKEKDNVNRVLILGLGGGSVAELVQKQWPESHKIGVDIDHIMIDLGRKYLKLNEIEHLKVEISDAKRWLQNHPNQKFDLILIDLYQGRDIPNEFKRIDFIKAVLEVLKKDGLAAFNHLYGIVERQDANKFAQNLHRVFSSITTVTPEANIIFLCRI